MQVQPQLILLQKTLLNVEGLGRDLYPQLDIWKTASPILREWMRERVGVRQVLRSLRTQMPELLEAARALPSLLKAAVHRSQGGVFHMQVESPAVEEIKTELRQAGRKRDAVAVGAAILLGGLVWLAVNGGDAWPGWVLTALGTAWLVLASRRR
jgi:ubiquinone biosynthesis protein